MTAPAQVRPLFSDSLLRYEGQHTRQTWATVAIIHFAVRNVGSAALIAALFHAGIAEVAIADISGGPAATAASTTASSASRQNHEADSERPALGRPTPYANQNSRKSTNDPRRRGAADARHRWSGRGRTGRNSRRSAGRGDWRHRQRYSEYGVPTQVAAGCAATRTDLPGSNHWAADPERSSRHIQPSPRPPEYKAMLSSGPSSTKRASSRICNWSADIRC